MLPVSTQTTNVSINPLQGLEDLTLSNMQTISLDSEEKVKNYLISYFALPDSFYDLRLQISEDIYVSKPIQTILRSASKLRRRFAYDREQKILKVFSMGNAVHDAIQNLLSDFQKTSPFGFFTKEEHQYIYCRYTGFRLSGNIYGDMMTRNKKPAWNKIPNEAIWFENDELNVPSVVFEVAFSEDYSSLCSDVKQWLRRSNGKVQLVVAININENINIRKKQQNSQESKKRMQDLMIEFGNEFARNREDIAVDKWDTESTQDLYDNIGSRIIVDDWVGPITAKVELWWMINGKPQKRGPTIDILPRPLNPKNPVIFITDIIPEKVRAKFQCFDPKRTMELDMERYRLFLSRGIFHLAKDRAIFWLRPKSSP